jgi:hypothetical protein
MQTQTPVPVPNNDGTNAIEHEPQMHGGDITEEHQGENDSVQENTDIQEIVLMAEKEFQEAGKMNEDIQGAGDLHRGDIFESTRLLGELQTELENLKVAFDLNTAREKKKIFDNTFSELKTIHDKALTAIDTAHAGAAENHDNYNTDPPELDLSQIQPHFENDETTDTNTLPPIGTVSPQRSPQA